MAHRKLDEQGVLGLMEDCSGGLGEVESSNSAEAPDCDVQHGHRGDQDGARSRCQSCVHGEVDPVDGMADQMAEVADQRVEAAVRKPGAALADAGIVVGMRREGESRRSQGILQHLQAARADQACRILEQAKRSAEVEMDLVVDRMADRIHAPDWELLLVD